jgi:hypothetical protein
LEQLTSEQISEWQAYDRLDPIGTWRNEFGLAMIASIITNLTISVHGKKGTKLTTAEDFLPKWGEDEEEKIKQQSMEEMKEFMLSFAKQHNSQFKKEKDINKIGPKIQQTKEKKP